MKLKDYIKELQKLAKDNPNAIVVYSSDSEGNSFGTVDFTPTAGLYNKLDETFYPEGNEGNVDEDEDNVKAICVN